MYGITIFMYKIYLPLQHLAKFLILKKRRDTVKISYEHRIYESVDDKSLSWDVSQKSTEKTE